MAAEFAVRDDGKAVCFLPPDHITDGIVLGSRQLVSRGLFAIVAGERLSQFLRSNQAADMIDPQSLQIVH